MSALWKQYMNKMHVPFGVRREICGLQVGGVQVSLPKLGGAMISDELLLEYFFSRY